MLSRNHSGHSLGTVTTLGLSAGGTLNARFPGASLRPAMLPCAVRWQIVLAIASQCSSSANFQRAYVCAHVIIHVTSFTVILCKLSGKWQNGSMSFRAKMGRSRKDNAVTQIRNPLLY